MPIYIYPDRIEFPNYSLRIDDAGVRVTTPTSTTANGTFTAADVFYKSHFQGQVAGYTSGGEIPGAPSFSNTIDRFPFATNANATDFGDLTSSGRTRVAGQSSAVAGYTSGGESPPSPPISNVIDKFPFASNTTATDVGDLSIARTFPTGQSSTVSGYTSGGDVPTSPITPSNVIDKFPFAADANATDVGDLTVARQWPAGQSSSEAGYTSGGSSPPSTPTNTIDKFPFAANANATDVGDLSAENSPRASLSGQSSGISGYYSGGYVGPLGITISNSIEKFPFATNANGTDVGDLTGVRARTAGQSSITSGYVTGGLAVPGSPPTDHLNIIDKFPFATNSNASDVGDLSVARYNSAGQQY